MKKRVICVLLVAIFAIFGTQMAFARAGYSIGPYSIELEGGLVLRMGSHMIYSPENARVPGLYRDGELVYRMTTFFPQRYLIFVSADGMHIVAFWDNWREYGNYIGTVEIFYRGEQVHRYNVIDLRFEPSGSGWWQQPYENDETMRIQLPRAESRAEITFDLATFKIVEPQSHINAPLIGRGIILAVIGALMP